MEKKKIEDWFRKEVAKDHREVLQHKRKVIEEIKKSSIQEFLNKRKITEKEDAKKFQS